MNFSKFIIVATISVLSASAYAAGPELGFPLGEKSRLHTNLQLGMGYDSNTGRDRDGNELSGIKSRVAPTIAISVPGSAFSLGLNGGLNIDQFVDGQKPCGRESADGSTATCIGGFAGLSIRGGGSNSVLGFEVDAAVVATPTDVFAPPAASADGSTSNEVRLMSDLGADELLNPALNIIATPSFILRPGGGALEFRLGYAANIINYESLGDQQKHGGTFEAKMRFLPRTAVVMNADFSTWTGNDVGAGASSIEATPYNVTIGLRGQLTQRLQANINAGYGDALNENDSFAQQAVIARTSLRYLFAEDMSLDLAYDRNIENTLREFSYVSDRPSLRASFTISERLNIGLLASYEFRTFASGSRADLATAGAQASYSFFDFLSAGLSYQLQDQRVDGQDIMDMDPMNVGNVNASTAFKPYSRQLFMFNVALKY